MDRTIKYTRESIGVSDAALGDISPDNTSAIIAAAEQASAPLIFQKLANHQFWEDLVHIFLDIIKEMYGVREIYREIETDGKKTKEKIEFDFSKIDYDSFDIKVNIGSATYWSQLMQVQTLDSFFKNGIIDDAVIYLEHVPEGYVSGKEELIAKLKERKQEVSTEKSGASTANLNKEPVGQLLSKAKQI